MGPDCAGGRSLQGKGPPRQQRLRAKGTANCKPGLSFCPPPCVSPAFVPAGESGYIAWYEIKALIAAGATVSARPPACSTKRLQPRRLAMLFLTCTCPPHPTACPVLAMVAAHCAAWGCIPYGLNSPVPAVPPCPQVTIHEGAKAAYLVSGSTWVGFDLPQTLYMKIKAADALGLGGLMVSASCKLGLAGRAGWQAGRPAGQLSQGAAELLLPRWHCCSLRSPSDPAHTGKPSARPPP